MYNRRAGPMAHFTKSTATVEIEEILALYFLGLSIEKVQIFMTSLQKFEVESAR